MGLKVCQNSLQPYKMRTESIIKKVVTIILFYKTEVIGNNEKDLSIFYILMWTSSKWPPFDKILAGCRAFCGNNCEFQNCLITDNQTYFSNILDYDVILFNIFQLVMDHDMKLPAQRSHTQRYVMVSLEPAQFHWIPERYNGFFNLTWTYRFTSDIPFPYIAIKDRNGQIIGPRVNMSWMDVREMNETNEFVKSKLQFKSIAAAWIVSNCRPKHRYYFAEDVQKELAKHGHRVDIYGDCGDLSCAREYSMAACYALIEEKYYFYFAFENSFDQDYVTEKLLHALQHYTVPVVIGSARYKRFMPKGIYINGNVLGAEKVAQKMLESINDLDKYYEYFRWHGYYSFHNTDENLYADQVCALCEFLNDKTRMSRTGSYNITEWWNLQPREDPVRIIPIIEEETPHKETSLEGFLSSVYNYLFPE